MNIDKALKQMKPGLKKVGFYYHAAEKTIVVFLLACDMDGKISLRYAKSRLFAGLFERGEISPAAQEISLLSARFIPFELEIDPLSIPGEGLMSLIFADELSNPALIERPSQRGVFAARVAMLIEKM